MLVESFPSEDAVAESDGRYAAESEAAVTGDGGGGRRRRDGKGSGLPSTAGISTVDSTLGLDDERWMMMDEDG